ncbi:hypothetical protein [Acinetobacter dispersus]|uniref:hypothetical protein n=1 Tax=Acinetobacter dispersus TaxID=70348 RepID=UPI000517D34D|nr:hypothetical protein [Acinetobacter dispersus]QHH96723.1 hypothetical protein FPL17_03870 [Acinetobacter dispersus]
MGKFLLGFILAWFLCNRYVHLMIAEECRRLGGFFVDGSTFKCIAIENNDADKSIPQVILESERRSSK